MGRIPQLLSHGLSYRGGPEDFNRITPAQDPPNDLVVAASVKSKFDIASR